MPDYSKYTNKQLADSLIDSAITPQELQKIAGQRLLKMGEPSLSITEVPKQQPTIIQQAQIASSFELRNSQKYLEVYYPQFTQLLSIEQKEYKIGDIISFEYEQVMKINKQHWTEQFRAKYLQYNDKLDKQPIFFEEQLLYGNYNDSKLIQTLGKLKFQKPLDRQKTLKALVDKNPELKIVMAETYNPISFEIKTGQIKQFKAKFLGSILNNTIGQFELL